MPNSNPDLDFVSSNEIAKPNTRSETNPSDEGPNPNADPVVVAPEADLLNVSGSGLPSTNVESKADPEVEDEKLKMANKQPANTGIAALAPDPRVSSGKDPPPADAKVEVGPESELNKPEVVRGPESLDEISEPHSKPKESLPLPESKEESTDALEPKPQCSNRDSAKDDSFAFSPDASRSSTPLEAKTALKAECESPLLIEDEEEKAGLEQNKKMLLSK